MGALIDQRLPGLPDHHVLLLNRKHLLVEGLLKLKAGSVIIGNGEPSSIDRLTKDLAKHLYDMARLGVGGLEPNELADCQAKSAQLMAQLIDKAI